MIRLLLALCLCLALALAPAALARDAEEGSAGEEPACQPQRGDDEDAAGDEDDELPEDEDDEDLGDEGEGDEGEDDAGDHEELGDPQAEAESARPAPGFRDFCEAPVFDRGFLRRTWRLRGASSGFGDGALTMTVASVPRVPARFRDDARRLNGLDMAVVVDRRTKLSRTRTALGAGRRGARRLSRRDLARARQVEVQGKLLPPARWRRDADGLRVPTLRARRVVVIR